MTAPDSWVPFRLPLQLSLYLLAIMTLSIFLHLSSRFPTARLRHPSLNATKGSPATPPTTTPATERGMWTVNSIGRLGNQMGEYATLYALAKMNGHQAYILPQMHQQLAPVFRITLPVISNDVVRSIPWRNYGLHDWMSEEYRHIKGKYVRLTGYPCSWTFYHHLRQEILQEFSFHDHVKEEANRYLAGLRGQRRNVTYVGVHVRRGDYVRVMPQIWKGGGGGQGLPGEGHGLLPGQVPGAGLRGDQQWDGVVPGEHQCLTGRCVFLGGREGVVAREGFRSLGSLQPHDHDHWDLRHLGRLPGRWGNHLLSQLHPPRLPLPPGLQA
ncbi:unnamed protein product [Lepidochelys kempii]